MCVWRDKMSFLHTFSQNSHWMEHGTVSVWVWVSVSQCCNLSSNNEIQSIHYYLIFVNRKCGCHCVRCRVEIENPKNLNHKYKYNLMASKEQKVIKKAKNDGFSVLSFSFSFVLHKMKVKKQWVKKEKKKEKVYGFFCFENDLWVVYLKLNCHWYSWDERWELNMRPNQIKSVVYMWI